VKITVRYLGHIRAEAGGEPVEEVVLRAHATVTTLLVALAKKHGRRFKETVYRQDGFSLRAEVLVMVNSRTINQLNELETELKNNDVVQIMPTVSGG
jgi:MoaD family protein